MAGITKRKRPVLTDQIMLQLHDKAKLDRRIPGERTDITTWNSRPVTTWMCLPTQGPACSPRRRRFALEQTFHLSPAVMLEPARSPLRVLERMTGRVLV